MISQHHYHYHYLTHYLFLIIHGYYQLRSWYTILKSTSFIIPNNSQNFTMNLNLHKVLFLHQTPDKFYIQPVELSSEALIIDRSTCEITFNGMFSVGFLPANSTSTLIYGVIGIKHLMNTPYLIVITKATQIGLIKDEPIYKMEGAQVIPFSDHVRLTREDQRDWDDIYVKMLKDVLKTPNYYFSYTYDLTNSLLRMHKIHESKSTSSIEAPHRYYDKRFLWNYHVMRDFDRCEGFADRYRLPFILGFISINSISIGDGLNYILLSRRSNRRAGTRFNCRGIDNDGNVSNFVETEQIIEEYNQSRASFIQIRGSIPLLWAQEVDYSYKPKIKIGEDFLHGEPMKKHMREMIDYYGEISIVNLIDSHGHEEKLSKKFTQLIKEFKQVEGATNPVYHYFDFHKECGKMRWHRLSILIDQIKDEIERFGFFKTSGNRVNSRQQGTFRVNCIDCLDRTNVVQSMIAHYVLDLQLSRFKTLPLETKLNDHPEFLYVFKNTWADNADALSIQYAGTPALKTDFTRTGQRTHTGSIKDGLNSLTRYVSNNFLDNYRQDAIDLLLGLYEGYPSPLYRPLPVARYAPRVALVILTFIALYIYSKTPNVYSRSQYG